MGTAMANVHGDDFVHGQVHQSHEKEAGGKADDDAPLLVFQILQKGLLFPIGQSFFSSEAQKLIARIKNGLLHILQANHAGIEGDIGLF